MEVIVPVPVYRTNVVFQFSDDDEQLALWDKDISDYFEVKTDFFACAGRSYEIYIDEDGFRTARVIFKTSKTDFGVIAHEIMHCVFRIMSFVDITLSEESEEAFTCLNEYLTEAFHREIGSTLNLTYINKKNENSSS